MHGFRKTFAFVFGATLGFTLLLIFVSFGLYTVIASHPSFFKYLECSRLDFYTVSGL
ncbi:hypothetical protein LNP25_23150 [Klebsiella variicola subsp. variicola]|nr:hypothetical protein [Klebsiella variicola subsp. variicola]